MAAFALVLPYLLSWGVLAVLMIVGMHRLPLALYTPVDGEWAKWNVEAILKFGKIFDLSPYSMLAGMGSMYFPNLPWLNPGALALGLPLDEQTKNIVSYAVYAAELAISIILLARSIGFSWLMATAAAQLYLYLLFPPFATVFQIYNWYGLAPYFAHLAAALNAATAVFLACGRTRDLPRNVLLCAAFLVLFISGLRSAPFTFVFATPAYIAISAAVVVGRRPPRAEWVWKATALLLCVVFFFGSGLLSYYLGTVATSGRTPTAAVAWDKILSLRAWLQLFEHHSLCQGDPRLLLCIQDRGGWLNIAALVGAAVAVVTRRGDIRTAGAALIAYIGLAHVYAYAYQAGWLGLLHTLSHVVELVVGLHVCGRSLLRAIPPAATQSTRGRKALQRQTAGTFRCRHRRRCVARCHYRQSAAASLRQLPLWSPAIDDRCRGPRCCRAGGRNGVGLLPKNRCNLHARNRGATGDRVGDISDPRLGSFVNCSSPRCPQRAGSVIA